MMIFGLVAEAAHGGHPNSIFDVSVGSTAMIFVWVQPTDKAAGKEVSIRAAIGVTAIGALFIITGLITLFH